jgi:hypothetical protein
MPIRYRRLILALRALKYYIQCPQDSYPYLAINQAIALGIAGHLSWAASLYAALGKIGITTTNSLSAFLDSRAIDHLCTHVERVAIHAIILKTLPLVRVPLLLPCARDLLARLQRCELRPFTIRILPAKFLFHILYPPHCDALIKFVNAEHRLAIETAR